jgi:thiol:disulfide interchange protein DsbD
MKHLKILALFILIGQMSFAQIVEPRHWTFRAEHVKGDEYNLILTMNIEHPWHGYSQKIDGEGPFPTNISIDKNPDIELIGTATESGPKITEKMDDVFGIKLKLFEEKAVFTQKIKLKKSTKVTGSVEAMVCNDNSCLPPAKKTFSIDISDAGKSNTDNTVADSKAKDTVAAATSDQTPDTPSQSASASDAPPTANTKGMSAYYQNFFNDAKFKTPLSDCGKQEEPITTWLAFILGFGGGLLALLTPCVFPMIPLTVSFFTKRGENKTKGKFESIFYGFSILLIFFLLSMPFLVFNLSSNTLNAISTNLWLNLFFFVIFLIFAFSFFGYYEIALPSSFASKIDSASNVGGLVGIFFMALTLVVVSFSCTGPILGTLLGSMATTPNGKLNLVVGMTSFGLAMGLPFTLFALFPNLLKSLPKSGSWMDSVKKVLGFVELILALKFLSNADLVGHWGLLKREIFLVLWALLGAATTAYLFGLFKFKSEGTIKRSPIRMIFAVLALVFTGYCAYGIPGNDLSFFSGFLPPNYYSLSPKKTDCPNDLSCFHDYDEAVAYARKVNKPIFIDFTGYNCANCRRMEENIWISPKVYSLLSEKFVIVSLYVDDNKRALPDSMTYLSPTNGEKRVSYGDKWSDFQAVCFNNNTQPMYVLLTNDEKRINNPWKGYDPDAKKFEEFLNCGLDAVKSLPAK